MRFKQEDMGTYRIFAVARQSSVGAGFVASVCIRRAYDGSNTMHEVYRNDSDAHTRVWESASEALTHGVAVAKAIIRQAPHLLR